MGKNKTKMIIVIIVIALLAFFAGMMVGKSQKGGPGTGTPPGQMQQGADGPQGASGQMPVRGAQGQPNMSTQ
jgi:hypothetical protein